MMISSQMLKDTLGLTSDDQYSNFKDALGLTNDDPYSNVYRCTRAYK